ncbi:hypothetical protein EDB86DRAFT_2992941 [Lactarius hatsudake]|nr:hypothetical protein EDB86DRAFT_2992941 [Lactarius hatsudake]
MQRHTEATHQLESIEHLSSCRGQRSSVRVKRSMPEQPLTNWSADDTRRKYASNAVSQGSHSQTEETRTEIMKPRARVIGTHQKQRVTARAHELRISQEHASSIHLNAASNGSLSPTGDPRTKVVKSHGNYRLPGVPRTCIVGTTVETQPAKGASHQLESQEYTSSGATAATHQLESGGYL